MRPLRPLLLVCLALVAACGNPFDLPRTTLANVIDTVTLYALDGTPPRTPSGYDLGNYPPEAVLIQNGRPFDFAVDLDSLNRAVLLPTGALHLGRASGVQATTLPFDSIKIAPSSGFQLDSAVTLDVGARAIVHSRQETCSFQIPAFYYGKLEILAVDTLTRRITFRILVDGSCGYRGLEEGVPSR
jgi:hypothetical protein